MKKRHAHAHREIAVWYPPAAPMAQMAGSIPRTVVLLRCPDPCRDLDAVTLAGKWTLAQVRGADTVDLDTGASAGRTPLVSR